jgi:hypothetical protein
MHIKIIHLYIIYLRILHSPYYVVSFYMLLAYFPSVARVFIYPNLIVICVPSLADNFYAPSRYITHSSADLHTVASSH